MNGQFKTSDFNKTELKEFAADLIEAGVPAKIVWRKRSKIVNEDSTDADNFSLEIGEKWFFRKIGKKGIVRFKYLNPKQEQKILSLLEKYHFYTEPNWPLGIGLVFLYLLIEYGVSATQQIGWFMPFIMISCALVLFFL